LEKMLSFRSTEVKKGSPCPRREYPISGSASLFPQPTPKGRDPKNQINRERMEFEIMSLSSGMRRTPPDRMISPSRSTSEISRRIWNPRPHDPRRPLGLDDLENLVR
jgi:hypothetical protein